MKIFKLVWKILLNWNRWKNTDKMNKYYGVLWFTKCQIDRQDFITTTLYLKWNILEENMKCQICLKKNSFSEHTFLKVKKKKEKNKKFKMVCSDCVKTIESFKLRLTRAVTKQHKVPYPIFTHRCKWGVTTIKLKLILTLIRLNFTFSSCSFFLFFFYK